jgi:hypothetical protein
MTESELKDLWINRIIKFAKYSSKFIQEQCLILQI